MPYKNKGFTIVELVMTMVLLAVLAATAIPRFADLGEGADEAAFEAVRGNFSTGIALVHSTSMVKRNKSASGFPDVLLEGQCIMVDATSGYPEIDQTTGTCTPVTSTLPLFRLDDNANTRLYAWVRTTLDRPPALFSTAYAVGPPPPPPPPPLGTSELPALLMSSDFTDWVWTKTPPTASLESPEGRSFSYSQSTGAVN